MTTVDTVTKIAAMPDILHAAELLEHYGLLPAGERATDVVKRFVQANPDINQALAQPGHLANGER